MDRLVTLVYDDLRRIARQQLRARSGQTLDTTALVHELYLKLVDQSRASWQDRQHFFAVSALVEEGPVIDPGSRVGPYEVDSLIGEGGMGRVLKARDVRLRRDVALKVLDVGEAGGHQAERFGREARAASALNHPHIATIYDIGQTEALAYIAMELVDGESLKQRLDRGPLALDEALLVAVQVADGLAAAHAKGIVHRDLKPGNIMLDADGLAKIVDFGLAKFEGTPADGGESTGGTIHQAPLETIADPLTATGLVFGTVTYMSPEQARGATVDYRSDLFSFGSLLYEIMSGERRFARPSDAETVAAILKDDPVPLDSTVPAPLRWAIDRCLQKEPGDRYESTRDPPTRSARSR